MDDIFNAILTFGITAIIGFFLLYVFKSYFAPKKLDELANMIKQGHYTPAIRKLNVAIAEDDRDPYANFLLGEAYRLQKKTSEAIGIYKKIVRVGRFNSKVREEVVRAKLANLYLQFRSFDDAKKEFLILTKLEPTNAENYYQVGILFENGGMGDKAINYFRQATTIDPIHEGALLHDGIITHQKGNFVEAKKALSQVVKLNPNLYEGHYYLGLCLKNQKDYDWALKEFAMALHEPKLKAKTYLARGLTYLEREDFSKAIQEFEYGLGNIQKDSSIELNLRYFIGRAAEKMRDLHTAITSWEIIHDADPKYKDVAEKLKFYEDFRTEDTIKDFMIATPIQFEEICKKLIEVIGLNILDLTIASDTEVHVMATESEAKWRNTKMSNRLVYIIRTTDPITEKTLREIHENMRKQNATKGICVTTSLFTSQAEAFSQSRPIELIDKTKLISYLRGIGSV